MTAHYEVKISAENQTQADVILHSLLIQKLVTGGQFIAAPARFLWNGSIEDMPTYVTITSYTTDHQKEAIMEDVRKTTAEDLPMITFVALDDLNAELHHWIDKALG